MVTWEDVEGKQTAVLNPVNTLMKELKRPTATVFISNKIGVVCPLSAPFLLLSGF